MVRVCAVVLCGQAVTGVRSACRPSRVEARRASRRSSPKAPEPVKTSRNMAQQYMAAFISSGAMAYAYFKVHQPEAEQDERAADEFDDSGVPARPGAGLDGGAVAVRAAEEAEQGHGAVTGEEQADDHAEQAQGIGLGAGEASVHGGVSFGRAGPRMRPVQGGGTESEDHVRSA